MQVEVGFTSVHVRAEKKPLNFRVCILFFHYMLTQSGNLLLILFSIHQLLILPTNPNSVTACGLDIVE